MLPVLPESPRDEYAWDMYDPRNPLNKRMREKGAGDALKKKDKLKMSSRNCFVCAAL